MKKFIVTTAAVAAFALIGPVCALAADTADTTVEEVPASTIEIVPIETEDVEVRIQSATTFEVDDQPVEEAAPATEETTPAAATETTEAFEPDENTSGPATTETAEADETEEITIESATTLEVAEDAPEVAPVKPIDIEETETAAESGTAEETAEPISVTITSSETLEVIEPAPTEEETSEPAKPSISDILVEPPTPVAETTEETEEVSIESTATLEVEEAGAETETAVAEEEVPSDIEIPAQPVPAKTGPTAATTPDETTEGEIGDPYGLLDDNLKPGATSSMDFSTGALGIPDSLFGAVDQGPRTINVKNDFIEIVVNTMDVDTGRFLANTVMGDPSSKTDDNKILIYGGSVPWTSFTTIRVDGMEYVFGGPTMRRAGRDALYGKIIRGPEVVGDNTIITVCDIAGLEVTQSLSIVGGPVSRLYDTIKINTSIRNPGMDSHRVGVRVVIDTLLGSNDGSPFKVADRNITSEAEMRGMEMEEYWIAFDSLENPGVVARGTIKGPGLTAPDRVLFANWGKIADNLWDVPFKPGQSFQREGEGEMDSAIALYWDETTLMPQGELLYPTLYGIDYLNVAGDVLSIGAHRNLGEWSTARNQIRPYTLFGYIGNSSEIDLHDVEIFLELPEGIEFANEDDGMRKLDTLHPGDERTVGWSIQPRVGAGGERGIMIVGRAQEVDRVELQAGVTLLPPPEIQTKITAPDKIERAESREYGPYGPPFPILVNCFNDGRYHVDNLQATLILPDGLVFPRSQRAVQKYARLAGQGEVDFEWKVNATGGHSGPLEYKIVIESDTTEPKTVTGVVDVAPLPVTASWIGVPSTTDVKVFFPAELYVTDIQRIGQAEFSVKFDPKVLDVVYVSQGTLFIENNKPLPWKEPEIDRKNGIVKGIKGRRETPLSNNEGSLVYIHFRTLTPGATTLELVDPLLKDLDGGIIEFDYVPAKIVVTED